MSGSTVGITTLHQWFTLREELFWVYRGEVVSAAVDLVADHTQGYWMWLVEEGRVDVTTRDGNRITARSGQWMLSPGGVVHQKFSPESRILSLHFCCRWPTGQDLFVESGGLVFDETRYPKLKTSAVALHRLTSRQFPGVKADMFDHKTGYRAFLQFQCAFHRWLMDFSDAVLERGRTLSTSGHLDDRLNIAISLMHNSPLADGFPEQIITARVILGRRQLDRLFMNAFGVSLREYWDRLREQAALRLIKDTRQSSKQIAFQLGFRQASHFTKWFTQRVGYTPTAFRDLPTSNLAWGLVDAQSAE
jgi:AraC-like DNA-binding protein